jgi:hypothetical protein
MGQETDTDPAGARWAGAGHSDDPDPARAGREAVAGALAGEDPRLVLVFASPRYDLDALAAAAHAAAAPAELIGCSSSGEIGPGGYSDAGVAAFALGGPGFAVATAAARGSPRSAGAEVAGCLAEVERRAHRVLMMLADGLTGDPQDVVRGAYSVAGATVPLVGGCAGDELRMAETHQIHGAHVLRGGVAAAALASDAPLGVGFRHGCHAAGEPLLVTRSEGATVQALNDAPALDVYLDLLGAPDAARSDPDAFTVFALGHPFGVAGARGREPQIRGVASADFERRALRCVAEVPQGTLVAPMAGERDALLGAATAACQEALEPLAGRPPLGLVVFDCVARRELLGPDGQAAEARRIAAAAAGAPVAGLFTYGEIARTRGLAGFHNHSLTVLAVG